MADVDKKVVQLTLDNKSFTKDTDQTIKSLDELKESLKFEGVGKGFDNITAAASKVDVSPVTKGVDQIGIKFNALATIADAALRNITTKALDSGERLIKSLSIDQVASGWGKFEEETRTVATLLAQGFGKEEVYKQLDKLSWFTDETSYNFTEMASNISKFTAAGKGLEESNTAMQGIALWAALSGQNASVASRAMYQLSQAMGAGIMRREDYKSMQTYNMDTKEFRMNAIEAAKALGTLREVQDGVYQSAIEGASKNTWNINQFMENLTEGMWFTSDVMMEVYKKYGSAVDDIYTYAEEHGVSAYEAMQELGGSIDAFGVKAFKAGQEARTLGDALDSVKDAVSSGWKDTFKFIIGDSEQATQLFSDMAEGLYNIFVEGGNARNAILKEWNNMGGRDVFIESLYKLAENLYEIVQTVKDAFHDIFPPMTLETVVNLTNSFAKFAAHLKLSDSALSNIRSAISGVLSVTRGGILVLKTIFKALSPIFQLLNIGSGLVLELTGNIGRLLKSGIDKITSIRNLENLYTVINSISKIIAKLATGGLAMIVTLASQIFNVINNIWRRFSDEGGGITGFITIVADELMNLWDSFVYGDTLINKIIDGALVGIGAIAASIGGLIDIVMTLVRGDELDLSAKFGDLGLWAKTVMEDLNGLGVKDIFDKITTSLGNFIETVQQFIRDLFTAEGDIHVVMGAIADDFTWIFELVKGWLMDLSTQDIQGFILIFLLWQFVDSMKQVNVAIKGTFTAISGTFGAATKVLKGFADPKANFIDNLNNLFNKTKILQIGAAALLLVQSLRILTEIDEQKLVNSVLILGSVAAIMIAVMKKFQQMASAAPKGGDQKEGLGFATQFLALSAGVFLIAEAASRMADVIEQTDFGTLVGSLGALTLFMAELGLVVVAVDKLSTGSANMFGAAVAIIAMASAVNLVVGAIMKFEGKSLEDIGAGIIAVATTLVALGGAAALLGKANWSSLLAGTTAIVAFSGALIAMAIAMTAMSKITEMGNAMAGVVTAASSMALGLSILFGVASLVKPTDILSVSAAIGVFGPSMLIFAAAMKVLSTVPWYVTAGGVAALVLALGSLAAINMLTGGGLAAVAAAIAAIGVAAAGIGAGLLLAANAAIKFVEAGALFVGFILGLGVILDQMGDNWPHIVDNAFKALYDIFSNFLLMIVALSPQMSLAAASLIGAIALGITMSTGEIIAAVYGIVAGVLDLISNIAGPLMDALIIVVNELGARLPDLMTAIGEFVEKLFAGIGTLVFHAVLGLIEMLFNAIGLGAVGKQITDKMRSWANTTMDDVTSTVVEKGKQAESTVKKVGASYAEAVASGAREALPSVEEAGKEIGNQLNGGFDEATDRHSPPGEALERGNDYAEAVGNAAANSDAPKEGGETVGNNVLEATTSTLEEGTGLITDSLETTITNGIADLDVDQFANSIQMPGLLALDQTYAQIDNLERRVGQLGSEAMQASLGKKAWEDRKFKIEPKDQKEIDDNYEESGEEAGYHWDEGLGKGIGGSGAGVNAAKTKAEEIKEAFQESFDRIQLDEDIDDLLYKLWGAKNPNATESEKTAAEIEYNNRKLNYAQGELKNYQEIYAKTVKAYGESSKEAVEALKNFIQAQTDVIELQNKISELQGAMASDSGDNAKAFMKFSQAVGESYAYLKKEGFSDEQIRNALANEAGWKQPITQAAKNLAEDGKAAASASANNVSAIYFETLLNGVSYNIPRLSDQGKAATEAIATGMKDNINLIETASDDIAQTVIDTTKPSWLEVGKQIDAGMEQGITTNADLPIGASTNVTNQVIDESKQTAEINSPSKKFIYIGEMMMEGLRVGIMNKAKEIATAAANVVKAAIAAAKAAGGIHSPSTEGIYIGRMFDQGIADGMTDYGNLIKIGAARIVNEAIEEVKSMDSNIDDYVTASMNNEKVIDVVLNVDTSELDRAIAEYKNQQEIDRIALKQASDTMKAKYPMLFDRDGKFVGDVHSVEYGRYMSDITKINGALLSTSTKLYGELQTLINELKVESYKQSISDKYSTSDIVVNMNQTNISPKPLTREEIYRDTKKQLAMFKESMKKQIKRR